MANESSFKMEITANFFRSEKDSVIKGEKTKDKDGNEILDLKIVVDEETDPPIFKLEEVLNAFGVDDEELRKKADVDAELTTFNYNKKTYKEQTADNKNSTSLDLGVTFIAGEDFLLNSDGILEIKKIEVTFNKTTVEEPKS